MTLAEKIEHLSPDARKEAEDFVEFLASRKSKAPRHIPTLSWAGCLKDTDGHKTSVELQHEIFRQWAER
jgi:hypothetical protein